MKPTNNAIDASILLNAAKAPYKWRPTDARSQRVSRRLLLTERSYKLTVNCPVTGVTSLMEVPAIPGYSLIWTSPLASLENCRGMVSIGIDYLRKLDTQILAGLLIVLADDYDLLRYQPADSGAQKNAIIRTAGKDTIISVLLTIENYVHSGNAPFLPKLSLIMDAKVEQSGIEFNMTEWIKTVATYILKADYSEEELEDNYYSLAPTKTISVPSIKKASNAEAAAIKYKKQKRYEQQKEYNNDIKISIALLKTLCKEETISPKLSALLKGIFNGDTLLTMDPTMKGLVASKMTTFTSPSASKLIAILEKPYALLFSNGLDTLEETTDNLTGEDDSSNPIPSEQGASIPTISFSIPSVGTVTVETIVETSTKLSLIERIKARKQQAARLLEAASIDKRSSLPQTLTSMEEQDGF